MDSDILVKAEHLHRWYGRFHAVNDVSIEVRRGEVLGLLGPNGAGKTTTMQMLAGALAPGGGSIEVAGHDLLDDPQAAKAQLGYLPEIPPLYPDMRVDAYLGYCARLHRVPNTRITDAVNRAKHRCGLDDVGARLIGNLSKGYQQRVGIAQAVVHTPAVVILDEPTVGLDPIQIREIRGLISELGKQHSVILSTHILPEVQAVCDRVQIMFEGRLVLNRSMAELQNDGPQLSLRVALRQGPEPAVLQALPGVTAVDFLDDGYWRLHHDRDVDTAGAIVAASVSNDWGLHALVPETHSLEQVFVNLTCGDESGGPSTTAGPNT